MSLIHRAVSFTWSEVNRIVRCASDLKPKTRYPFRVIVVGNIEAGGTGKTPITAELANHAIQKGKQVVILTRGYDGSAERRGRILAPQETATALEIGDEPALLRSLVPGAWIGIGADRKRSLSEILVRMSKAPDLVLLDDGLQQFWLEPSERIICISGSEWGEKVFFRERFSSIRDSDTVVLTKSSTFPHSLGENAKKIRLGWQIEPPVHAEQKWHLVHGVGRPETVRPRFENAGWKIETETVFADHAKYDRETLEVILKRAKTSQVRVVTTGKDAVKWKALGIPDSEYVVVEPRLKVMEGLEVWNSLLSRL